MAKPIPEITREKIIKAAIEVFSNVDFHQATVRDIAKRADIALGSIYNYFENKEQIIIAVSSERAKQLILDMKNHLEGIRGTENKIRKMTWYYLNYFENNTQIAWITYVSISDKTWHESSLAWQNRKDTDRIFMDVLREGQKIGDVRSDINIRMISYFYFGGMRLAIVSRLLNKHSPSLLTLVDDITAGIYDAVKLQPSFDHLSCIYYKDKQADSLAEESSLQAPSDN